MDEKRVYIEKLVLKAGLGDQSAWSELYNETFRSAYFVAIKITGNEDDAIELLHDAYITAFKRISQLSDKSKFQSWLNMIVANKCRDYLRKRKPILFSDIELDNEKVCEWVDESEYGKPEEIIDKAETVRIIADIMETLPEEQKLCIILYYWNEFSVSEIASSLEISDGTVKSRLNYARIKIKAKVEELEKRGTKLYGIAPIPLFVWSLKSEAAAMTIPINATLAPIVVSPNISTTATTVNAPSVDNLVARAAVKTIMGGIVGKVAAGVATLSLVLGGVGVYNHVQDKDDFHTNDSAYILYEELLSKGVTENGLKITHYAYVDLESDNIPELLVSDNDGTPDSMSACELFTCRNNQIYSCNSSGSYYDYFYLINDDKYVRGCSRKGNEFISINEKIKLTSSVWNETLGKSEPAIARNNGEWEYITEEEFESYQSIPNENVTNKFIQSATPISLKKNTYVKSNLIADYLNYTDSWGFLATMDDSEQYFLSMAFAEDGKLYSILSFALDEQPIDPMSLHKGSYTATEDKLSIKLDKNMGTITYQFDNEAFVLTQISDNGLFRTHKAGDAFKLVKDNWNSGDKIKKFVEDDLS